MLHLGCRVDVICPEEKASDNENLTSGLDRAGNSGKPIANLLFKKEDFTSIKDGIKIELENIKNEK